MKFKLPKLPFKLKLPFGKSAPEDFDNLDEDLGDAPPPAKEDDEDIADEGDADESGAEESDADEGDADESGPTEVKASKGKAKKDHAKNGRAKKGKSRKKLILVASALLAVAVGGGATGYFLVIGGDPAPHQAEQAPASNDTAATENGASVSMSLSGFNEQPPDKQPEQSPGQQPGQQPEQALLSPPEKVTDTTAQTDASASRRPWLQVTPDSPDGGVVPGGMPVDGAAGTPPNPAATQEAPIPPQQQAALPQDAGSSQDPAPAQDPAVAPKPETASAPAAPMSAPNVSADGIPQLVDPPMPTPVKTTEPPRPPMWNDLKDAIAVPPLDPAPMDGLQEDTPNGKLPIVSAEGVQPWNAYSRPFQERGNARAAIIITGLGMRKVATEMAIKSLPAQVTLAFSPYASNLNEWIAKARLKGHEVLISLPMESNGFPARDPGPIGVLTLLSVEENNTRLLKVLGKTTGYVGIIGDKGDRFLKTSQFISPVLEQLSRRGLLYVDNGAGMKAAAVAPANLHYATSELIIDEKLFKESIQARLRYLITVAQKRGHVTAIASSTPGTITAIVEWAAKLPPTKVELAPITAVVNK